jgi:cellulose biosynthesis protein BcsQ
MVTLAVYSNKGGVGKTTTAVNISYMAARDGIRTLIVDLDPQSSATFYFRVKPKIKKGARGLSSRKKPLDKSIKGTDYPALDLLPGDFSHRKLDAILSRNRRSRKLLLNAIKQFCKEYDLVVIDSLPSISASAENVFRAADLLLVPVIPTTLCFRTHEKLFEFLSKKRYKGSMVYSFFSMVDRRKRMHLELMDTMRASFPGFLETEIPYLATVERMGITREPVPASDPFSLASEAYENLWAELAQRIEAV